jgi:hypothetical protein
LFQFGSPPDPTSLGRNGGDAVTLRNLYCREREKEEEEREKERERSFMDNQQVTEGEKVQRPVG